MQAIACVLKNDTLSIKPGEEMKKTDTTEKSEVISNAGIIMMHPFFKNIFKATGLMYFDDFKDDHCKQKAVLLLQYLATGNRQATSSQQPLNNILCGLPSADNCNSDILLNDEQVNEADELLEAVISHWTSLQNSATATLQQTFFQRNGILLFDAALQCWKLKIERVAADALLEKIPWSIQYIHLPWMKNPLLTEW